MNRNVILFTSYAGIALSFLLLALDIIPEWVGAGYAAILITPITLD